MADFDNLHTQLSRQLRPVYEQMCENTFDPISVSRMNMKGFRYIFKRYGDETVTLMRHIAGAIEPNQSQPLLRKASDRVALTRLIEQSAQHSKGSKRGIGLVVRTAKQFAKDVQTGKFYNDLEVELVKRFMRNVYEAEFADVVPSMQPTNGATVEQISERLLKLQPLDTDGLEYFAKQIIRDNSMQSLHLRRRKTIKPVDLTEDLYAVGQ